ncbi:RMD1 family protein [Aquirufa sp. 5-AUSEE-100C1]|jgi:uncharacterized Rmd1/YagE family protein
MQVKSYQIADYIDIKSLRFTSLGEVIYADNDELFFQIEQNEFLYILRYGVLTQLNLSEEKFSEIRKQILPACRNLVETSIQEDQLIETGVENKISHNKIQIKNSNTDVLRMVMLYISQSVTLDYYAELTTKLLEDTNQHTQLLERKGKLSITGTNLKKYIGKTLLLKNLIAQNLYIFDSPEETWDNERLDKLHIELKRHLDLQDRARSVSEELGIVKENLELFKDILQYRNSIYLEWVVIILIAIEVVNFLIEKLFA